MKQFSWFCFLAIDKELLSVKRILEEKDVEISQLKSELQDQEGKLLKYIVIILLPLFIAICSQLLSNCEKKQQEIDTLYVEMHSVNPQSQGEISDLKKIISGMLILFNLKVNDIVVLYRFAIRSVSIKV